MSWFQKLMPSRIRTEGGRTPQLTFMVNTRAGETAQELYTEALGLLGESTRERVLRAKIHFNLGSMAQLSGDVEAACGDNPDRVPSMAWFKTRKGRGYGKYDYPSHGAPHKSNSPEYWATKKEFADKYGIEFEGMGEPRPESDEAFHEQVVANNLALVTNFLHLKNPTVPVSFIHAIFDGIDGVLGNQFSEVISLLCRAKLGSAFAFKLGIVIYAILKEFRCRAVQCNGNFLTGLVPGILNCLKDTFKCIFCTFELWSKSSLIANSSA